MIPRNASANRGASTTGQSPSAPRGLLRRAPIVLGTVTGLVVCALAFVVLQLTAAQAPAPIDGATTLCTQLKAQHYAEIYSTLSARLRAEGNLAQFAASQEQLDALYGKVTACSAIAAQPSGQTSLALSVTRERQGTRAGSITLIYEDNAWKIDSYDSSVV
jgi:hypothetical protein